MPVFGLVGAGNYDVAVLEIFLRRLRPDLENVLVRRCGNDYRVTTTLGTRIREFQGISQRGRFDKAIVVKDSHRADPQRELQRLRESMPPDVYAFPIEFAVAVYAIEAWLLADHEALSRLSEERGAQHEYRAPDRSPELIPDPKGRLSELLAECGVSYTEAVAVRIAELANLDRVEQLCSYFRLFKHAAEHC